MVRHTAYRRANTALLIDRIRAPKPRSGTPTGGPSNQAANRQRAKRFVLRQAQHALSLSKGEGAEVRLG